MGGGEFVWRLWSDGKQPNNSITVDGYRFYGVFEIQIKKLSTFQRRFIFLGSRSTIHAVSHASSKLWSISRISRNNSRSANHPFCMISKQKLVIVTLIMPTFVYLNGVRVWVLDHTFPYQFSSVKASRQNKVHNCMWLIT